MSQCDILINMRLSVSVLLKPSKEQHQLLLKTLQTANAACNFISQQAWENKTFGRASLHKLTYYPTKEQFNLTAQMVVRAIAKVVDSYKVGKKKQRKFKKNGAFPYDGRILRWNMADQYVNLWTIGGRQTIPFLAGTRQLELLKHQRGETDLVYTNGKFYLHTTVDVEEADELDVKQFLGVDVGIKNIAVDSDGNKYSGQKVHSIRVRRKRQRERLQKKGTKSAKRLARRLSGKEHRFVSSENHRISKELVEKAKRTGRGVALENLTNIRTRQRVKKSQRYSHNSWAFYQLQQFIVYKARLSGVPVVFVDPKYTSQTCPYCGHVAKSNRKTQANFVCQSCGYTAHADWVAARNISCRAVVNQPHVSASRQGQAAPL